MVDFQAANVERIALDVGEMCTLESLRQAVVPPFVMIVPFIELPEGLNLVRQDRLDEDGVHGCTYTLRASSRGEGTIRVGFRSLVNRGILLEKSIDVIIR